MPKHISIGERLSRAKSEERRVEIAKEWAKDWIGASNPRFKRIEENIRNGDYNPALEALHDLYQETFKRLYALSGIFEKIASAPKQSGVDAEHEELERNDKAKAEKPKMKVKPRFVRH